MSHRLDCLVIGYNDMSFSLHERQVLARDSHSPERRVFMHEHLLIDGKRLPYMDVINYFLNNRTECKSSHYYHVGEMPNLAAVYLSSYLIRHGFSAQFVSLFGPEKERLARMLEERAPRAVAITTTFYLTMPLPVVEISTFVRQHNSETQIIVGGPLINNLTADLDAMALQEVFVWMGGDVYVRESQGEATLVRVLQALRGGDDLGTIPNLYILRGGSFQFTRRQAEDNMMDDCAIDWDLFSDEEVGTIVQTRTARGCAYSCSFCDYPVRAGRLSLASVETVERELQRLARRGVQHVVFIDDTFNVPAKRFNELCRMMIRNEFDFRWYSYFRCSSARDEETYDLMQQSGCCGVFLGIESGDDEVLRNMSKVAQIDQYRYGMEQLHKRGIVTFASFVVGFPGETERSVSNTINFINETQPTFFRGELWWYNHRAPIHKEAKRFGLTGHAYKWKHATMDIDGACDAVDIIFAEVTGSVWMTAYNFDFWAYPYLSSKGFTVDQVIQFHRLSREVMRYNETAPEDERSFTQARQATAALEEFFAGIKPVSAKYQI